MSLSDVISLPPNPTHMPQNYKIEVKSILEEEPMASPDATATVKLVDYYAPWCGPCRAMEPIMEELEKELKGKVIIERVNVDEDQARSNAAGVMSIPTLHIEKDGKVVNALIGFQSKEDLAKALAPVIN